MKITCRNFVVFFVLLSFPSALLAQNVFPTNGNVGIGTTNPDQHLTVDGGNIKLTNSTGYPFGYNLNMNISGGWARDYSFSYGDSGKLFSLGAFSIGGTLQYGFIGGNITTNTTAYNTPWMVFLPSGNIGIGTKSPATKLQIDNGEDISPNTGGYVTIGSMDSANIGFDNNEIMARNNGAISPLYIQNDGGDLVLHNNNAASSKFAIKDNGNVLIGKISQENSSYKLDVNGNVRANKVVVNTTGADYVFDQDFNLLPMDSLQRFVNTWHHLPDIPPASALQRSGMDIGEMQKLLLQKIEELSLYMIHMNQRVRELERENRLLKRKLIHKNS
jgi:hypothetical protein